jgi:hypothetical protein
VAVIIDDGLVERLVVNQLASAVSSTVTVLLRGEAQPTPDATAGGGDGVEQWARVVDVSRAALPQQAGADEPHKAAGVITVACGAAAAEGTLLSPYAIKACLGNVAAALGRKYLSGSNHEVTTGEPSVETDPQSDDQRAVASGVVTVPYTVSRTTGSTVEAHPA